MIRSFLLLVPLAALAQTLQITSLGGTWDFAFAPDSAASERLARFHEDGF
jgi:hypothetical protein